VNDGPLHDLSLREALATKQSIFLKELDCFAAFHRSTQGADLSARNDAASVKPEIIML